MFILRRQLSNPNFRHACGHAFGGGEVYTPSFGSHLNPISTRGQIMPTLYTGVHNKFWKPQAHLIPDYQIRPLLNFIVWKYLITSGTVILWFHWASGLDFGLGDFPLNFIYSEKAPKFCDIFTVDSTGMYYIGQIYDGDFTKICGFLWIYEL